MTADTIFALASAPGKSGVAVIRVSGPGVRLCLSKTIPENIKLEPNQIKFCKIIHPVSRETIDRAMVAFFATPASFTGEDVAEYHLHGGPAIIREMLEALAVLPGHRMAEPGEFTRRAFENGKLDLTAAEAVADLVNAETQAQKSQALAQLGGALSALYDGWRETLTRALAHLEADIDFPDEDLPGGVAAQVRPVLAKLKSEIDAHLNDNRRGERLRDGIHVAVIGAPNAGKSSLVNALARRDVAIVSEHAGTTRDVIEVHLDLGGYPVILADTAGLRPDQLGASVHDVIESEGIRRALDRAKNADIKLLMFDVNGPEDAHTLALADENSLLVYNKADLKKLPGKLAVSAQTGEGLDALTDALVARISTMIGSRETPSLTRQRHRDVLTECAASLTRALNAGQPELMAEDTRLAVRGLGRITGRVDVEDLLDVIFRDFCIGK